MNINEALERLNKSAFRSKFHLSQKDIEYIKDKGLDISVKKSMSDDDIRDAIREALKNADEDSDDDEDDTEEEEDEKPVGKVSLDDIRKKLAGKK